MRELRNKYRAYDAEFLYNMLKEDTTMMFLGGGQDADYQAFFDSIQQSSLGRFARVYDSIEVGAYESAAQLNGDITPEHEIFENLQTVLAIYLDSWCKDRYTLTQEEHDVLFAIADQTPYEAGDAVYTARIMIGYEPDENTVAYRVHKPTAIAAREQIKLYPNPASDEVTIEFENPDFSNVSANVKVYSITGKLVGVYHFQTSHSFKVLSTESLQNGIYLYRIELNNGISKSGKLVIMKE